MQKPRGKAEEKKPESKPADQVPPGNNAAMSEKPADDKVPDQPIPATNSTSVPACATATSKRHKITPANREQIEKDRDAINFLAIVPQQEFSA